MINISKFTIIALCMLSIVISVASITVVQIRHKQMQEMYDAKIQMLRFSYFIGCAEVSDDFDACHIKSAEYINGLQ